MIEVISDFFIHCISKLVIENIIIKIKEPKKYNIL
jgi:hypothetical protein